MTDSFARRFTTAQRGDANGLFATPIGSLFARHHLTTSVSPQMIQAMQGFAPKICSSKS